MLENIVDHETIGTPSRLYAVALRGRFLGSVEVAVSDFDPSGLMQPHMIPVGVQGCDILDPAAVCVVEVYVRKPTAITISQRKVLNPVQNRLRPICPRPPRPWRLRGSPVRHVEAREDGDLVPIDGRHLHELLLVPIGHPTL